MPSVARASSPRSFLSALLLAASVIVGLLAVSSTPAGAEFDTVTRVSSPNPDTRTSPPGQNQLFSISCVSSSFCMAGGRYGSPWSPWVMTWDGTTWSIAPSLPVTFRLHDIECASSTFCMAVGYSGSHQTWVWDGTAWALKALASQPWSDQWSSTLKVSCASPTFCVTVGQSEPTGDKKLYIQEWNGTSWANGNVGDPFSLVAPRLNDVDCDSTSSCVAVGAGYRLGGGTQPGMVAVRNSGTGAWTIPSPLGFDTFTDFSSVSCQGASCVLYAQTGVDNGNFVTNRRAVVIDKTAPDLSITTLAPVTGDPGSIKKFVCPTPSRCIVIGSKGAGSPPQTAIFMSLWDGSTWSQLTAPTGVGYTEGNDIECLTVSRCIAVGYGHTTSGIMGASESWVWEITDTAAMAPTTTTAAPTTVATPEPVFVAPTVAPTTLAPTTTPSRTEPPATTVPAPALSVVRELPVAATPIVANPSLAVGGEVAVTFGGFTPFEFVQLIVASTPQVIGSGYADAQGVVTISGNLPTGLASGSHTLAVYAPESGVGFSQPIRVTAPRLPVTGSDDPTSLYVMALTLLVGGLLIRRVRVIARP